MLFQGTMIERFLYFDYINLRKFSMIFIQMFGSIIYLFSVKFSEFILKKDLDFF